MILNSYHYRKALFINKKRRELNSFTVIIPHTSIFSLMDEGIEEEYVPEIKNIKLDKSDILKDEYEIIDIDDKENDVKKLTEKGKEWVDAAKLDMEKRINENKKEVELLDENMGLEGGVDENMELEGGVDENMELEGGDDENMELEGGVDENMGLEGGSNKDIKVVTVTSFF